MTMSPSIAAAVALVLLAAFSALGFGWRSWLQRRRTGSFGFHGVSGRIGSVDWIAVTGAPIYSAMLIFEFGIILLATNLVAIAGFLLALVSLELQVRRIEEPHLLTRHGALYRDYTSSLGRFIPGVGLIR
jgi:protein-S-isoprenylcysteine O-methyltransferase Ste14